MTKTVNDSSSLNLLSLIVSVPMLAHLVRQGLGAQVLHVPDDPPSVQDACACSLYSCCQLRLWGRVTLYMNHVMFSLRPTQIKNILLVARPTRFFGADTNGFFCTCFYLFVEIVIFNWYGVLLN